MPVGAAVAGASVSGGFALFGQHKATQASKKATAIQQTGVDKQIALQREEDARRQQEYDREQADAQKKWEAEQAQIAEDRAKDQARYEQTFAESMRRDAADRAERLRTFQEDQARYQAKETRLQPYRQAGVQALGTLNHLAGQVGVQLMPVGQGQLTKGLPGAPGAAPYVPPPPPAAPTLGQLVPARG